MKCADDCRGCHPQPGDGPTSRITHRGEPLATAFRLYPTAEDGHREHVWEPVSGWTARYRCATCRAIGYKGNLVNPQMPGEPTRPTRQETIAGHDLAKGGVGMVLYRCGWRKTVKGERLTCSHAAQARTGSGPRCFKHA